MTSRATARAFCTLVSRALPLRAPWDASFLMPPGVRLWADARRGQPGLWRDKATLVHGPKSGHRFSEKAMHKTQPCATAHDHGEAASLMPARVPSAFTIRFGQ